MVSLDRTPSNPLTCPVPKSLFIRRAQLRHEPRPLSVSRSTAHGGRVCWPLSHMGKLLTSAQSEHFLHEMAPHWTNDTVSKAYCTVTLLEELLTHELAPTTTQIPRSTWVTNVCTLQRYLLSSKHNITMRISLTLPATIITKWYITTRSSAGAEGQCNVLCQFNLVKCFTAVRKISLLAIDQWLEGHLSYKVRWKI